MGVGKVSKSGRVLGLLMCMGDGVGGWRRHVGAPRGGSTYSNSNGQIQARRHRYSRVYYPTHICTIRVGVSVAATNCKRFLKYLDEHDPYPNLNRDFLVLATYIFLL